MSAALFVFLAVDFFDTNSSSKQSQVVELETLFAQPKRLGKDLLDVESKWLESKAKRKEAEQPEEEVVRTSNTQQILTLGDKNYVLYGIFDEPQAPFILLKEEGAAMIKLAKGDKLSENATLITLQSNKIAFDKNNQIIEFKLFERKNNAPN